MVELLTLRDVRTVSGRRVDVLLRNGQIVELRPDLAPSGQVIEGGARTVLRGLTDHHLHLFATAARRSSIDLADCTTADDIIRMLRAAPSGPVRAIGYNEAIAGLPDRIALDGWIADRPLRIQDRTGALWLLNSAAVAALGAGPFPPGVEVDAKGAPTGRIRREDRWLRTAVGSTAPSLAGLSRDLARWGVTAVTDAGAANGPEEAALFEGAVASGDLLQRLTAMGREDLPASTAFRRGPLKLHYDEPTLPDVAEVAARIAIARTQSRAVAAHCVTAAELLFFLAALEHAGGAHPGDRIEHGSVIPASLIADIALAGLTVVSNPGFVHDRGDRYLRDVPAHEQADLYRLASLRNGGVGLLGGSDAPYGAPDPWVAIRAAIDRRTSSGAVIGAHEALDPTAALALYGAGDDPAIGDSADLCLVSEDWTQARDTPVSLTIIAGKVVFSD